MSHKYNKEAYRTATEQTKEKLDPMMKAFIKLAKKTPKKTPKKKGIRGLTYDFIIIDEVGPFEEKKTSEKKE